MSTEEVKKAMAKSSKKNTLAGLKHTDISTVIESMRPQIAQALPKHLTADRVIQMATTLIAQNPKIAECSASSLMGAVMQASILGFKPVSALGECYFVPYGGEVQFQVGYKGYISLARKSGNLETIHSFVVRKDDDFEYELGLHPILKHIPNGSDGDITHAYAVVKYKDGGYNFVVLSRQEIERLRCRSPFQKPDKVLGAWKTDYEAMCKAKAIKQLAKFMPSEIEDLHRASQSDEAIITDKSFSNNQTGINPEAFSYEAQEEVEEVEHEEVKADKDGQTKIV